MLDHRDVMVALAKDQGWRRGIELGIGQGLLLSRLLNAGVNMIGVDLGLREDRRAKQETIARKHPSTCRMFWMATRDAADKVDNGWADFLFIDAAHSYRSVKEDIERWSRKVRPGGWIGGHDYHPKFPGVIQAVNEAFQEIAQLPHYVWAAI